MNRMSTLGVALLLALATTFGVVAATRTARLGAAAVARTHTTSSAAIRARQKRLDRVEASLRRALAARTPALPPLPPKAAPVAPALSAAAVSAAAPAVVYRRPPPVVIVKHRHGSELESSDHGEGGGDD